MEDNVLEQPERDKGMSLAEIWGRVTQEERTANARNVFWEKSV